MKKTPIYGTVVSSIASPQSLYRSELLTANVLDSSGKSRKVTKIEARDTGYSSPVDISWLPFAAKEYDISPNIKDYVVVNIPIITSDFPNRNSQAFSLASLTEFDTECGRMRYKTFIGKAAFEEHDNKNPKKAKGVILDASLQSIPKYGIAKVNILEAFCIEKDSRLANDILSRKRTGYSMGAMASRFKCSVCGGLLGPSIKNRTCTCTGTDWTNLSSLGTVKNGRLHYHLAEDYNFFETSSVADPADSTAYGNLLN